MEDIDEPDYWLTSRKILATQAMETRKRFKEVFEIENVEKDYGTMHSLAMAHREYVAKVKQRHQPQEQPRVRHVIQWMEVFRATVPDGAPQLIPYAGNQSNLVGDSMQFEAAGFLRRFFAEVVDFLFVLTIKLGLVALLLDLELIDLGTYGASMENDQDVTQIIILAQELLPLEMASKFICCLLEAFFMTYRVFCFGVGQTPGKSMMGIRVISCRDVSAGEIPGHIIAHEPNLITLGQALKRSFLKNVVVNSLFPLSTAAFQIQNGRVFYDCVVGTAVVFDV
uniref:RDD domain-containing protein n=1 Tax=Caenorhabditis tropicalis TaxID=1561998 RepID=A0A1I7UAP4_9PELO